MSYRYIGPSYLSIPVRVDGSGDIFYVSRELDALRDQLKVNLEVTIDVRDPFMIYTTDNESIINQKLLDARDA